MNQKQLNKYCTRYKLTVAEGLVLLAGFSKQQAQKTVDGWYNKLKQHPNLWKSKIWIHDGVRHEVGVLSGLETPGNYVLFDKVQADPLLKQQFEAILEKYDVCG